MIAVKTASDALLEQALELRRTVFVVEQNVPEEAEFVRSIFERFVRIGSIPRVIDELNEEGIVPVDRRGTDTPAVDGGRGASAPLLEYQLQHARRVRDSDADRIEPRHPFGDWQVDAISNGLAFERDGEALGPEPVTVTHRAFAERAIRIELLLHRPRSFFESASQVREHAFEVLAEWIGGGGFRLSGSGFSNATTITFLAQERVRVSANDFARIRSYFDEAQRAHAPMLAEQPCADGEALPSGAFLCR